jgi:hypothetical protein
LARTARYRRAAFRGKFRQERPLLLLGCESDQDVTQHQMSTEDPGEPQPTAGQLFEDHRKARVVDIRSAILLRNVQAEEAELLHLIDEGIRVFVIVLHSRGNGDDFTIDELLDGFDDQPLFIRQVLHLLFSSFRPWL